jgi:hypothetical protein
MSSRKGSIMDVKKEKFERALAGFILVEMMICLLAVTFWG